jgi:hypothetical protein
MHSCDTITVPSVLLCVRLKCMFRGEIIGDERESVGVTKVGDGVVAVAHKVQRPLVHLHAGHAAPEAQVVLRRQPRGQSGRAT